MTYIAQAIIAILMFPAAWYLNREIGNGDEGLFKTRVPVFIIWAILCGVLSYSLYGATYDALVCTWFGGTGYWIFRQLISPTPAHFAGHGGIDPDHKPTTNVFVEWLAVLLFKMDREYPKYPERQRCYGVNYGLETITAERRKEYAIEYGLWVGGLVGFLKSFGWCIIGAVLVSPCCLVLPIPGISYGGIHWFWGQYRKVSNFRPISEKTVGVVIIAPNTIIPIWFYDGGLLNLIN